MRKQYLLMVFMFIGAIMQAQFNVNINVTDSGTTSNIESADVTFDSTTLQTDVNGNVTFSNIANGTYNYSVSFDCYTAESGTITVSDADVNTNIVLSLFTTTNVFWQVNQDGSPVSFPVPTAEITISDGVNAP
ncbi:hypothetical protein J4050_04440, partial [Winogradskyella sp. DF17]